MVKRVYRIENSEGAGPFWKGHVRVASNKAYGINTKLSKRCNPAAMPPPYADGEIEPLHEALILHRPSEKVHFLYAFPTLKALRRWFRPAILRELAKMGLVINIYNLPDEVEYKESPDQVLFDRRSASFVREYASA